MHIKNVLAIALLCSRGALTADEGGGSCWTWASGSAAYNGAANYGSKGSASAAQTPGARTLHTSWTTPDGKVYVFGGLGIGANPAAGTGALNDVWLYSGGDGTWSWIAGQSTLHSGGVYSGAASAEPGARYEASSWADGSGRLWLFGGRNGTLACYNDLWRFDPPTRVWVNIGGNSAAVVVGSADAGLWPGRNVPSSLPAGYPLPRAAAASWLGSNGDAWLFGGIAGGFMFADLWRFRASTNEWTFVSGTPGANTPGSYSSNTPPSRFAAASWADRHGALYLFAGYVAVSAREYTAGNDLWRFSAGNWTVLSGTSGPLVATHAGTLNVASPLNQPEVRANPAVWSGGDTGSTVYMFGGAVPDDAYTLGYAAYNDLWAFDTDQLLWTWLNGNTDGSVNAVGIYGTRGQAAAGSHPSGRTGAAAGGISNGTAAFVFGGLGVGGVKNPLRNFELNIENDLWLLSKCPPEPVAATGDPPPGSSDTLAAVLGGALGGGGGLLIIVVLLIVVVVFVVRRQRRQQQRQDAALAADELQLTNGLVSGHAGC
eukprot:TRINITY_DN9905_c1_g2_i6.p2 TRINITY_DN9905_c1_g2~~TRINITY_DN9905_c1_g2_i6.p2  ORF type:complete len:543 (-),score=189.46 TRINITY_DN9905_c1_g2_i6:2987-4615(-)